MLRGTLLYLSEQPALKRVFGGPLARPLVRRFVAGETLERGDRECTEAQRRWHDRHARLSGRVGQHRRRGRLCGHAVHRASCTASSARARSCNASLKLTQMGLDVDRALCRRNVERIVAQAAQFDNFIRIDMEGSDYTQTTLDIFKEYFRAATRTSAW